MKLTLLVALYSCAFVALAADDKPVTASPLDREILKRTDAQMQAALLQAQTQYQQTVAAIQAEQKAVYDHYCPLAKLPMDGCAIDRATGAVTKVADAPKPAK